MYLMALDNFFFLIQLIEKINLLVNAEGSIQITYHLSSHKNAEQVDWLP